MGMLDFLKKKGIDKAAKTVAGKVSEPIGAAVKSRFANEKPTDVVLKATISQVAGEIIKDQANEYIPSAMSGQRDKIIEIATDQVVEIVYDQIKDQIELA